MSKLKNIKKRNRTYEQSIPNDYLMTLQDTYLQYIKQQNIKTLIVDTTHADFIGNEAHFQLILDALDKEYEQGQHYISLP